jgi:hypothetical protein
MDLDANRPTVIDIVDGRLSNGRCHSMSLTVWTVPDLSVAEQKRAARLLAIGFLERTLAAMRSEELN